MKLFKGSDGMVDERIRNIQNKIYKEAFILVVVICLVSITVKFLIHGFSNNAIITELAILFVSGFYYWIRSARLGLYKDMVEMHDRANKLPMSTKNIIIGIISGVAISLFFGIRSSILYGGEGRRVWYFILVFFASFMIYCPIFVVTIVLTDTTAKRVAKKTTDEDQE